ncbi:hypothetical protein LOC67_22985 [Stieleria sp. JC731]|uniref:hypothetical protein n=1 Tax=Pirellulaceae TaxID=2691357 RepID=UPI001E3277F9|nr:hypothetical protein [Stieleria sp. JC731]MCC9603424.1 hypothetical protein [Stieleria sp. JC731]
MIQLEAAHFSNLIAAVQRTGSLPGGAVRGLPNEVVIDGLPGVGSYPSSVAEAQKEFELGRSRTALERVRQLETSFSTTVGQWNGTVNMVISGAKQGRQAVPAAKLNEVRNAQTRMQGLINPAIKAFRDLVTALEFEITLEGHQQNDGERPVIDSASDIPKLPGTFAKGYRIEAKLDLHRGSDNKVRVDPQFQPGRFYLLAGDDESRVIRVDELSSNSISVYDFTLEDLATIQGKPLLEQIKRGVWLLARD